MIPSAKPFLCNKIMLVRAHQHATPVRYTNAQTIGKFRSIFHDRALQNTAIMCLPRSTPRLLYCIHISVACGNHLPQSYQQQFVKAPVDVARVAAVRYPSHGSPRRDSVQLSFSSRDQVLVQRRRRRGSPVLEPGCSTGAFNCAFASL